MVMEKAPKTISKYPRKNATLDAYWLGPSQHLGDGPSTDPAIRWNVPKPGTKRQQGEEAGGPPEVEIE
jgi:hypothetical protein